MSDKGGEGRYVRAVEAAWSKLRERPIVLSPRDFEIVDGWRRRGIPLAVVLEVFDHRAKRRGFGGGRSLTFLASSIEAAWEAVAAGRAVHAIARSDPRMTRPGSTWNATRDRLPDGAPLKSLLTQLAEEAASGTSPDVLNARLDEALPRLAPEDLVTRAEHETAVALEAFRTRMSREEFERTRARALTDRLREALSLARLPSAG